MFAHNHKNVDFVSSDGALKALPTYGALRHYHMVPKIPFLLPIISELVEKGLRYCDFIKISLSSRRKWRGEVNLEVGRGKISNFQVDLQDSILVVRTRYKYVYGSF